MGVSNKANNKSSFKRDRRYETSTSFQEVPRLFNRDGNTRKKRSDSDEVSIHSSSETKLSDDAPIILTWVPKEKGRSLPDGEALSDPDISKTLKTYDYYKIIVDHIQAGETRDIYICVNGSGLKHGQKTEIEQRFNNELQSLGLSNKIQQIKVVDLHNFDWSSINHGWKIDGEDIDIKEYYKSGMYDPAKAQGCMTFPTAIDTFRMIVLALSEQITGKRGAIYVDFDTLGFIGKPLGHDITIPDGILIRGIKEQIADSWKYDQDTAIRIKDFSVQNDLIAINDPNMAVEILSKYKGNIKSEWKVYDDIERQVLLEFPDCAVESRSLNELLSKYEKKGGDVIRLVMRREAGRYLVFGYDSFEDYVSKKILDRILEEITATKTELWNKLVELRSSLDTEVLKHKGRSKSELKHLPLQDWGQSELTELNLEDWTMAELARMLPDTSDIKTFKTKLQNRLSVALKAEILHIDFIANGGKCASFRLMQHHYSWISTPYYKVKRAIALLTERMSSCPKKASTQLEEISRYVRQNGITNFDRDLEALSQEIRDFLHDKNREAFIAIEEISKNILALDKQGQITRNREALKTEIKKLIEDFKENDIDINTRNSEGETLLHLAARIGDKSLVSYLLSEGASFDVQNNQHLTPAGLSRVKEVSDLLISVEAAFSVASDGFPMILLKVEINNSGDVQVLVKAKNGDGHTLLSLLVSNKPSSTRNQANRLEIVNLLIDKGADINFKDAQGNSLLYTAISNTDKEVVGALLKKGAVIDDATKLIVKGMKAIPNPNEDIKVILEKLEQHTLEKLFSNLCSSSTQKRKKRQPCDNSDLEKEAVKFLREHREDVYHMILIVDQIYTETECTIFR